MGGVNQKIFLTFLVLSFLFAPSSLQAANPQTAWVKTVVASDTLTGKVVGVSDGDTISVMRGGRAVKVRLHGIDCPEKKQPFGTKAKQFTSGLANKGAALKFWRSKSKGEVDFVLEGAEELIPIEVKAGRNQKPGKSLLSFMAKYSPSKALILCGGNVEIEQRRGAKIIFLPLYLAPLVSRLLEL